jgi:hypothetical protein
MPERGRSRLTRHQLIMPHRAPAMPIAAPLFASPPLYAVIAIFVLSYTPKKTPVPIVSRARCSWNPVYRPSKPRRRTICLTASRFPTRPVFSGETCPTVGPRETLLAAIKTEVWVAFLINSKGAGGSQHTTWSIDGFTGRQTNNNSECSAGDSAGSSEAANCRHIRIDTWGVDEDKGRFAS